MSQTPPSTVSDPLVQALTQALGAEALLLPDHDLMANYRTDMLRAKQAMPRVVVRPDSVEQVAKAVRLCAEHNAQVIPFGGNSGFCGGSMADNSGNQVVLSLQRMNKVTEVDELNNTMTVQAGCILAELQQLASDNDRLFPLSHGGEGSAQIGGCLSTNAGGNAVLRFGMARDLVLGLQVVLPDGQILDSLRGLRKDNAGYDLKQLFLGTEGTLGIITAAVLKLYPKPRLRETALVAVPDVEAAVRMLAFMRSHVGDVITAFELMPQLGVALAIEAIGDARPPFEPPQPWQVLLEMETSSRHFRLREALEEVLETAMEQGFALNAIISESDEQRRQLWRLREGIALAAVGDPSSLKNDQSVPCSRIPEFVRRGGEAVRSIVPDARTVPFGHMVMATSTLTSGAPNLWHRTNLASTGKR